MFIHEIFIACFPIHFHRAITVCLPNSISLWFLMSSRLGHFLSAMLCCAYLRLLGSSSIPSLGSL